MKKWFLNFVFVCIINVIPVKTLLGYAGFISEKDESRVSVVVIDPGHGGRDLGASVGNAMEKDIVLAVALKLGELISTNYPETTVIYTRKKDVFIPVYERAEIANQNKADLFISIHVNGVEQTYVQGTETFVLGQHRTKENLEVAKKENSVILLEDDYSTTYEGFDPNSPESYIMFELIQNEYLEQSVMFASEIQDQFREQANRVDRSVKQSGFIVLRQITMPGVLIEAGFISNPQERNFMFSNEGKVKMASSIFEAFKEYKRKIEEKSSFNIRTESDAQSQKKSLNNNDSISVASSMEPNRSDVFFSVQISASTRKLKPTPANFKREKNIFRKDDINISRYFKGRFDNYNDAVMEKERIGSKFPDAFVVAFENGNLISVKKLMKKGN